MSLAFLGVARVLDPNLGERLTAQLGNRSHVRSERQER
jgi:hypothetical protein